MPIRVLSLSIALTFLSLTGAFAQAKMAGQVIDTAGNPVAGATVRIDPSDSRGRAVSATTNNEGVYRFSFIVPATYRVFVEAEGLAMVEVSAAATKRSGEEAWSVDEAIDAAAPPEVQILSGLGINYNVVLDDAERAARMAKVSTSVEEITALVQKGDCAAALPLAEGYLEAIPDAARVHYLQGFCLASTGRGSEAAGSIEKALELEPGMGGAALLMGQTMLRENKPADAVAWLQREIDEGANAALKASALTSLGLAHRDTGDQDQALEAFTRATEIDDANDIAWVEIARIHRDRKNLSGAEQALGEAIELDEAAVSLLLNIGIDHYNAKSYDDAVRVCQEVLASAGEPSQSAMAYAVIARSKLSGTPSETQKQQAEAALRKSLDLDPKGSFAAENREILEKLKG